MLRLENTRFVFGEVSGWPRYINESMPRPCGWGAIPGMVAQFRNVLAIVNGQDRRALAILEREL